MKSERTDPGKYAFPEGHLKALIPGETGSVNKDDAKNSLKNKIGNFDQRLQHLIDDIAFLFQTDEIEGLDSLIKIIAEVDKRDEVGSWEIWDSPLLCSSEREFGLGLAQIARPLIEENKDHDQEEIAWGFIIGLISESPENFVKEEKRINKIISIFEEYTTRRREHAYDELELSSEYDLREEAVQAIKNVGFVPTHTLTSAGKQLSFRYAEKLDLEWEEGNSNGVHRLDVRNFEKMWENALIDLVSENSKFLKINCLRKEIDDDYEKLSEPRWNNIRPFDVVRSIADQGGEVKSKNIATDVSNKRENLTPRREGIGKVGRDLAGLGEDTVGPNWDDRPILELTSTDPQKWRLTNYGKLLSLTHSDTKQVYEQLHAYALKESECSEKELISNVLEEYSNHSTPELWDTIRHNSAETM